MMMMMGRIRVIVKVVIFMSMMTMMTTRRMLLIMVLSHWQRSGGVRGKEHHGVRAPNQGHRTGGGTLQKPADRKLVSRVSSTCGWHLGILV